MATLTIQVPPAFEPALDALVQMSQAGSREQWISNHVRGVLFDYQLSREFGAAKYQRLQQLATVWPGPLPPPPFQP